MLTRRQQEALLRKVDALIDKHRPKASTGEVEAIDDVPLLTDVAAEQEALTDAGVATQAKRGAPRQSTERLLAQISDDALRALAAEIFERIERHLDERVAQALRQRVRMQVERAMETTLADALAELRRELLQDVGYSLARAQPSSDTPSPAPKPKRAKRGTG